MGRPASAHPALITRDPTYAVNRPSPSGLTFLKATRRVQYNINIHTRVVSDKWHSRRCRHRKKRGSCRRRFPRRRCRSSFHWRLNRRSNNRCIDSGCTEWLKRRRGASTIINVRVLLPLGEVTLLKELVLAFSHVGNSGSSCRRLLDLPHESSPACVAMAISQSLVRTGRSVCNNMVASLAAGGVTKVVQILLADIDAACLRNRILRSRLVHPVVLAESGFGIIDFKITPRSYLNTRQSVGIPFLRIR